MGLPRRSGGDLFVGMQIQADIQNPLIAAGRRAMRRRAHRSGYTDFWQFDRS